MQNGPQGPDQGPTHRLPSPAPTPVAPAHRRSRLLAWGGPVAGVLLLLAGAAWWVLRPETVDYDRYENEYFAVDYPRGWEAVETDEADVEEPNLAEVTFRDPSGDFLLSVVRFTPTGSSSAVLRHWDGYIRDGYADYQRIDLDRRPSGETPGSWDVAYHECTYTNGEWPTPERHRFHQVITIDGADAYSLYMIVPADAAFSHRQIRADITESLRPLA